MSFSDVQLFAVGLVHVLSALALVGVLSFTIGSYYILSVYTVDEKAKRNSTPGRLMISAASYYICTKTPNGSSLVALFGLFSFITGVIMGLTVGFGDGNAVDYELKEAEWQRERKRAEAAKEVANALQLESVAPIVLASAEEEKAR